MPWRDPTSLPLTRIDIVAQVPSASGVYAVLDGDAYLLVGEAWNLKARLLELMNVLQDIGEFQVKYELCTEDERIGRKDLIAAAFLKSAPLIDLPARQLPGITFWNSVPQ